jgi:hypothetical protein
MLLTTLGDCALVPRVPGNATGSVQQVFAFVYVLLRTDIS